MIKKPSKYCKFCKKEYTKSPEGNKVGLSKFCSITCYIKYSSNDKKLQDYNKWTETNPPKHTNLEDLKEKLESKRFISKSQLKRITNLMSVQKQDKPDRDSTYLEFVRSFPCMICGKESTAHHVTNNGISSKGSDYLCVPLCYDHHVASGDSVHKLGNDSFQKKFNINFKDQQNKLLINYIRLLKATK